MTEDRLKKEGLVLSTSVYPLALRLLGNPENARDAVQQGMLKLWEKRHQLDHCKNLTAFVFTVVRNVCLDEMKRKKPLFVDDFARTNMAPEYEGTAYEHKEAATFVKAIIGSLPPLHREVISLRDIDGLEFDEIAGIMNIDISYARVLLSRARKQVREQLEKVYGHQAI
jgi:RNA polymerase sigma-70 factor (ECF subfamily)